jgi:AcrR family transcriptional regulator
MRPEQRREAILMAATEQFAQTGYRGTSTATLAAACGVTQPILYRHFPGKAELYMACLESAWDELRRAWEFALAGEPEPRNWLPTLTVVGLQAIGEHPGAKVWIRSLADLHDDERIRGHVIANVRDVHQFITDVVARSQAAGGVAEHVNPRVEAWMFLSTGILFALSHQLDDIVGDDFFVLLAQRYREVDPAQ